MSRIPIFMKTWAGSEAHDFNYISRSLPSLLASDLPDNTDILVFDDCSPNEKIKPFLESLARQDKRLKLFFHSANVGPNKGQERAVGYLLEHYPDAPFFVSVDDDIIYHNQWLRRLMTARTELNALGINGIFTALNIAYRPSHASVKTQSGTYLLKWRQPSLNWLIPAEVVQTVGNFKDEGIAFDTVYFHHLRLYQFPHICLKPSYVQNIGTFGAYSQDTTTASDDFVGSGNGLPYPYRLVKNTALRTKRFVTDTKAYLTRNRVRDLNPIRWGVDWLFEARQANGDEFVFYLFNDSMRMGWNKESFRDRVAEIKSAQPVSPFEIRGVVDGFYGGDDAVFCEWSFMPNLKDCKRFPHLMGTVSPVALLKHCAAQLAVYHQAGVVHNKIRMDNIFSQDFSSGVYLAWFGSELSQGEKYPDDTASLVKLFATALDKRASSEVRETAAVQYLMPIAPEVLNGEQATLQTDIYSLGTVIAQYLSAPVSTLKKMNSVREQWSTGIFTGQMFDAQITPILRRCCAQDPKKRFPTAMALLDAINAL
ncbi:MAG: glycosyltransferase [Candidatus Auribacterota bacterium]